jgi:hypothetical protein
VICGAFLVLLKAVRIEGCRKVARRRRFVVAVGSFDETAEQD